MQKLFRKFVIVMAAFFLPALLSVDVVKLQELADPDFLPVDMMQVLELPAYVTNPILLRSGAGFLMNCQIANNSDDPLLGFTYHLLVLDSTNKLRMIASRTVALKLAGHESRDLTLPQPRKLKVKNGDRVVLSVEQVITRSAIWEVLNSREALLAYGRGEYLAPEVKRVLNLVDPKPRSIVIR